MRGGSLPVLAFWVAGLCVPTARAQAPEHSDPVALNYVRAAVADQLYSDAHDIPWMYHDHDIQPGRDSVRVVCDTPQGGLGRTIMLNGKTLTGNAYDGETRRIQAFVNDPGAQARKRRDERKDDAQSEELLKSWPEAFLVTIASETPEFVILNYYPNPAYSPSTIESKVMTQMQGQIVITRNGNHIYTVRGRLMHDVSVAFGLVKLKAGGNFSVERREVAPGHWQVVEQHTHIAGHALLFKSISAQEDDWKTEFKPSPAKTLEESERILDEVR